MNNASIILFIVGTVVLIFSFSLKMSNFLDVRSIFLEHFSVFKGNPLQLVSIFIVPVLFSIGILNIRCVDSEILKNGTPHSRYFSDELGVPTLFVKYRTSVCYI